MTLDIEKLAREASSLAAIDGADAVDRMSLFIDKFAALVLEQAAQKCDLKAEDLEINRSDEAYNAGVRHCAKAIRAMKPKAGE